jgi:hypothetical protein
LVDEIERPEPAPYPRALAVLVHVAGLALIGLTVLAAKQLAGFGMTLILPEDRDVPLLMLVFLLVPLIIGRRRFLQTTAAKLIAAAGFAYGLTYAGQALPPPDAAWVPPLVAGSALPWVVLVVLVAGIAWIIAVAARRVPFARTGYEWATVLSLAGFVVVAVVLYSTVARHYDYELGYTLSAVVRALEFGLAFLLALSAAGARGVGPAVHLYAAAVLIAALAATALMAPSTEQVAFDGWWPI